jgi:hypothetical protein
MKKLGFCVASLILACALSGVAEAKVLEIYVQAQGGGGTGWGVSGVQKDNDFFHGAGGGAYGAKVGAEVLWIDGWIEHVQFNDGSLSGTWTQFMFGFDWDFALGDAPEPDQKPKTFGQVGIAVGYGVGTGQQVDPPLDAGQLTDQGFLGQLNLTVEHRFNAVIALGLTVPITYGYIYKRDEGAAANDESRWYGSVNAMALVYLRFYVHVK